MSKTIKGKAAIIATGSVKPERRMPGRSGLGVAAEAAINAMQDAAMTQGDIDGLIT